MNHLIENYYLIAENVTMKQAIGIPNHFLYFYEEQYMPSLIYSDKVKARDFHSARHLIDDLYAINDRREFGRSIYVIYPKELQVKVEDQGDHAMFSNLDITIMEGTLYI